MQPLAMPDSLEELLDQLSPALELVFRRHRVPPERAAEILAQALRIYARKARDVENPEVWLLELVLAQVRRTEDEL
jgi:hypothetical protein